MREKDTGRLVSWWEDPEGRPEDGAFVVCPEGCEVVDLAETTLEAFDGALSDAAGATDVSGVGDAYLHDTPAASRKARGETVSPPHLPGVNLSVNPPGAPLPSPEARGALAALSALKDALRAGGHTYVTPAVIDAATNDITNGG